MGKRGQIESSLQKALSSTIRKENLPCELTYVPDAHALQLDAPDKEPAAATLYDSANPVRNTYADYADVICAYLSTG